MSEVDAIVVLTVGRSRATTHFHLKWAKTLGERVLVLASCRNESGVAMIQEAAAINKERVELLTYTGQTDTVTDQISQEVIEHTSANSGLQTKVVFAGGEKSVYCNVYQRLISQTVPNLEIVTEPEMLDSTTFTTEDWVIANESPFLKHLPSEDILIIEHEILSRPIRLTSLGVGKLANPTRLLCKYEHRFDIGDDTNLTIKKQRSVLANFLLQMNLVFTELGLTTEFRVKFSPIIYTKFDKLRIYADQQFLARSVFIAMTSSENFILKFDNNDLDDDLILKMDNICTDFFRSFKIEHANLTKKDILSDLNSIRGLNLNRTDSMKWIHPEQIQPKFFHEGQDVILVDSGYNGRELADELRIAQNHDLCIRVFNECMNQNVSPKSLICALIISLNINHYLNQVPEFEKFPKQLKSKADKNIENDHLRYVSIHKIQKTVVQKGRDRGKVIDAVFFSLNDGEKIHEMDKNKFAEFLLAFALYATPDKSLVEDRWVYKNEKLQPPVVNYLWKIFGLKSEHRISPDGFHIADKGKGLSFEIWDAKSTYDFSKGIMEKFTKYDKLASKFPMETTTCVFSIFGAPGYEYDKGEAASHREELQHLLQSSNKRKLRILDIRDFVVNEHKEIFRIELKHLQEFLCNDSDGIQFYRDWIKQSHKTTYSEEE